MGSFFNKLAGYSPDGTKVVNQGGYWYRLEFHQNDTIADYDDLKTSCTGYYLVNGSFLEKPVYEFAEVEFTLADADKYDKNPDDGEMIILVGMMNLPEPLFPGQMLLSIRRVRLPA